MSEHVLKLSANEKEQLLSICSGYVKFYAAREWKPDSVQAKAFGMLSDFTEEFKVDPLLEITCSRVFIKLLRMHLQMTVERIVKLLERYNKLNPNVPPFEPEIIGRRKEDYINKAQAKLDACATIMVKIEELVG